MALKPKNHQMTIQNASLYPGHLLVLHGDEGVEVMRIQQDGKIFVHGKEVGDDREVVYALEYFLKYGQKPCPVCETFEDKKKVYALYGYLCEKELMGLCAVRVDSRLWTPEITPSVANDVVFTVTGVTPEIWNRVMEPTVKELLPTNAAIILRGEDSSRIPFSVEVMCGGRGRQFNTAEKKEL